MARNIVAFDAYGTAHGFDVSGHTHGGWLVAAQVLFVSGTWTHGPEAGDASWEAASLLLLLQERVKTTCMAVVQVCPIRLIPFVVHVKFIVL